MFIYPDNLTAKAKIWMWELRDVAIIVSATIFSVFALAQTGIMIPLVITFLYGVLSIQVEDMSILRFLKNATFYFLLRQQHFDWEA